jgi:hypothetical protein
VRKLGGLLYKTGGNGGLARTEERRAGVENRRERASEKGHEEGGVGVDEMGWRADYYDLRRLVHRGKNKRIERLWWKIEYIWVGLVLLT